MGQERKHENINVSLTAYVWTPCPLLIFQLVRARISNSGWSLDHCTHIRGTKEQKNCDCIAKYNGHLLIWDVTRYEKCEVLIKHADFLISRNYSNRLHISKIYQLCVWLQLHDKSQQHMSDVCFHCDPCTLRKEIKMFHPFTSFCGNQAVKPTNQPTKRRGWKHDFLGRGNANKKCTR